MKIVESKKKITCSPVHIISRIPSEKNGERTATMSRNERNVGWKLETLGDVVCYKSQPFTCEFEMEGKIRRYTPDFEVHFKDIAKPIVIEVKPAKFLEDLYLQNKLKIVARDLPKLGYNFMIMTDDQIPTKTEYSNFRFLYHHRTRLPSKDVIKEVLNLVVQGVNRAWMLDDYIQRHDNDQSSVYAMIAHGYLYADVSLLIDYQTQVFIAEGE
jgi:hypothetical protein